jgi:hypothetical protein
MNIFDLVNAAEIATYYTGNASNRIPYLGQALFPRKKQLGLTLSWIKGSNGLPAALMPAAFDTKATIRSRIGFGSIETEMPFFKESMVIKEKERQELNKAMSAANADYIMPVIRKIYDDAGNLVAGAEVDCERMRMQLLSTGKIVIAANGISYDYDYHFNASHKETLLLAERWSDTVNSNPVEDIRGWQDTIEDDTGVRPTMAICTRKTWNYLLANAKIKLDINVQNGANILMTDKLLKSYLAEKLDLRVAVYNKKYATIGADGKPTGANLFFPDETFTLIPEGNLGDTYYGTTPEESDLMSGNTDAQVQIVDTGVAITTSKQIDPVNVVTKVSMISMPSFETIDQVFIATVA